MLDVLDGNAESITIEKPGEDAEEYSLLIHGKSEHWQTKRQRSGKDSWTLASLADVLNHFFQKHLQGEKSVFASVYEAPQLGELTQNAQASRKAGHGFEYFKVHFLSQKREKGFRELKAILKTDSDEQVFDFLCSVRVEGGREITLEKAFSRHLETMFRGPAITTMAVLRDLYLRSTHETLRREDIERHLNDCQVHRRRGSSKARERITEVTATYIAGQHARLIRRSQIRGVVAADIVERILNSDSSLDVMITSPAGGGKSGCLLQIADDLLAANVPVLAFRLDNLVPVTSLTLLGEQWGLAESPVLELIDAHEGMPVVLIVDQLDAVSSVSGRHQEFFDTVAALYDEVLSLRSRQRIHLVFACRKFDLEHDHRLKQLISESSTPIEIGELHESEVSAIVNAEGGNYADLTVQQKRMLSLPQNLSLFVGANLARSENRFSTHKDLCDAYWDHKRRKLSKGSPDSDHHWLPVIRTIVTGMSERQSVFLPKREMDNFPPELLSRMVSEGLLVDVDGKYGFGHETFFDYCFARTLPNGGRDFVTYLENDEQLLFRRAQLRQVLTFLRDDNPTTYLHCLEQLLNSSRIRPHLKLLAVEQLAALEDSQDEELNLLMPWIEEDFACRRAQRVNQNKLGARIAEAFLSSRSFFPTADRLGFVSLWLHAEESWMKDTIARYLAWQKDVHGDRIAAILRPLMGIPEWHPRLCSIVNWVHLGRSRAFFEFFLNLLDAGLLDEADDSNGRTMWSMVHGLNGERAPWCAELAGRWLHRKLARLAGNQSTETRFHLIYDDQEGVDMLAETAKIAPKAYLKHVLSPVLQIAETCAFEGDAEFPQNYVWMHSTAGDYTPLSEAVLEECQNALQIMGRESPGEIRLYIDQLHASRTHTANHLLLATFTANPGAFSEEAITALTNEPARLRSGASNSPFWLALQAIEICSPHCTGPTFSRLEAAIFAFPTSVPHTVEEMRNREHGAYTLASCLPRARISAVLKGKLREWTEKFTCPHESPPRIAACFAGPPIEENSARHMSDQHWLGAVAKYDEESRHPTLEIHSHGGAIELAILLQKLTSEEPERFAQLALHFPAQTHPTYFSHVIDGLKDANVHDDLRLAVARRIFEKESRECYRTTLQLLTQLSGDLPQDAVDYIEKAARHSNPTVDAWEGEYPHFGGDIMTHGINTVRGFAAEALRSLLAKDPRYVDVFQSTLESLSNDPSLGVRACMAATLHQLERHDEELARRLSLALFDTDDRLLATSYAERYLHWGLQSDFDRFAPYVKRMLTSEHEGVRKCGGILAALSVLYHPSREELSMTAMTGDMRCRLGACEVAMTNLLRPECRAWCESALTLFFHDDAPEVRRQAAGCFRKMRQHPDQSLRDFDALIRCFLSSAAFATDPTYLLHALEKNHRRIPEATLDVCDMFIERCAAEARDISTSLAADEMTVAKLVFTAYAQLPSTGRRRALDAIDRMCLEGFRSAGQHFIEVER